jgi:hypothetical protein
MANEPGQPPGPRMFPRLAAQPAGETFHGAGPVWHLPELSSRMILPKKLATLRPLAELLYGERGTVAKGRHGNGKRERLPPSPDAGDGRRNTG